MSFNNVKNILRGRFGGILILYILFIGISFISRSVLLFMSLSEVSLNPLNLTWSYLGGFFMDTVAFSYFMIPFVLFLMFVPDRLFNSSIHKVFAYTAYFITFYILLFNGISEYFFWEEFGVRYNFIAVDYLIYTTEVLGNIKESYPIPFIVTGLLTADALVTYLVVKSKYLSLSLESKSTFKQRFVSGISLLALPVVSFFLISNTTTEITRNHYNNELAKNGIHSLFAAFLNNELEYGKFYLTRNEEGNFKELHTMLKSTNSEYINNGTFDITRKITNPGDEKRYNVVFITVESLSAKFLGYKGGDCTPNLNVIADSSMLFTNLYAIGTRTIYGLEATTLGQPPKPGQSVIKRPGNENMFSLGQLFKQRGYNLKFIYGGYGYFDNMNYYFSHNGYEIVDRNDLADDEITFANTWGVCDQDILNRTLKECDKSYSMGKPFLNHIMTTSNHRPFTYPDGVIDIPSHVSREGGVKYCDYAIGEFIRKAKSKPWFKNTLFVIVADHCAGSAGKAELPFMEYQIPLIVYNPYLIQPQKIDKLCSQIDVAPTVLGVMNWTYDSKFFGKDILKMAPDEERAFISNYQKLGYIENNKLTVLSPQQMVTCYAIDPLTGDMKSESIDKNLQDKAITYYQSAEYLYQHKLDRW
ncbi:MAG: LTA synthase family protein [Methylococcaceae bacterium]